MIATNNEKKKNNRINHGKKLSATIFSREKKETREDPMRNRNNSRTFVKIESEY
jgi:hypothetical protein